MGSGRYEMKIMEFLAFWRFGVGELRSWGDGELGSWGVQELGDMKQPYTCPTVHIRTLHIRYIDLYTDKIKE